MDWTRSWTFDPETRMLTSTREAAGYEYEIDLDRCATAAAMLDWIFQIQAKTWRGQPEVTLDLVHAFAELLHPQATLCSMGQERGPINVARTLREMAELNQRIDQMVKEHGVRIP